jgi:Xaa-Pro dipeptidase
MNLKDVQSRLQQQKAEGWLVFDFQGRNDVGCQFLQVPKETHLTRRFFYWIPAKGEPVRIVHAVEAFVLDHLPGEKRVYATWQSLEQHLRETLKGVKAVAMEFSPKCAIPYVSKVDGGTVDFVRSLGVDVISSAPILQYYTSVLTDFQLKTHLEAARVLDQTAGKAWKFIKERLSKGVTEYEVVECMREEIEKHGCVTDSDPFCGVNKNSASPHYAPLKESSSKIRPGDFILIDLWCKTREPESVFADITRVAVAGEPTERQQKVFQAVRGAQKKAVELIEARYKKKEVVRGYEVDNVARKEITDAGFGPFFTHRTGHNIYTTLHGPGANIDGFETLDERPLIPRTLFSIEPGIYLPDEFGLRLEHDVYIHENGEIEVTGGIQEAVMTF